MLTTKETESLFATLAELGGKAFKEEDIIYEGNSLKLPSQWRGELPKAIDFLKKKMREEEEPATFSRIYNYRPWDGAYNAFQAMKKAFGMVQGKAVEGFFGSTPPQYIQVPISPTETEEVPWGNFAIPLLENTTITFGQSRDAELGPVFIVAVESPRKNRFLIEGLFKLIDNEIKLNSIYRGKAIDGKLQFIDLSNVKPERVIYDAQVKAELEANVWGFMRHNEAFLKMGMPSKRSILLEGYYGTGKTMTANVTALEAVNNGWTFIMARPGRDNFFEVMQTAKLYQPAVVFMEDADTIAQDNETDTISQLLDVFDGIQAKNTRLMVVLTTNHAEKLTEGMRRPGRIDQIIHIGALDGEGIERLVRLVLDSKCDPDMDFKQVVEACKDYMPAFIKEAADRSIRYAVVRTGDASGELKITTDDMLFAARSMRSQHEWMTRKAEGSVIPSLDKSLQRTVQRSVADMATTKPREDVWDPTKLTELQRVKN